MILPEAKQVAPGRRRGNVAAPLPPHAAAPSRVMEADLLAAKPGRPGAVVDPGQFHALWTGRAKALVLPGRAEDYPWLSELVVREREPEGGRERGRLMRCEVSGATEPDGLKPGACLVSVRVFVNVEPGPQGAAAHAREED